MPESSLFNEIKNLSTEQRNVNSENIDISSVREILELINSEDKTVAYAVEKEINNIEIATYKVIESFQKGGRLFYFGAGTSGRLGVLDAAECPPTFGSSSEMVQGFIAGGEAAMFKAQEGAEDSFEAGADEIDKNNITNSDIVCGIAASGRTPYVKGALEKAKQKEIFTIIISTVPKEQVLKAGMIADCYICPEVGAEVLTGSTRMKSGTAQKLILNMITTTAMIRLGKTYNNVMIDLQMTNLKLKERAKNTVMQICDVSYDIAENTLILSNYHVKTAIFILLTGANLETTQKYISEANGFVKIAIEKYNNKSN
ncbi:MAG: N-acetylmuramic acid 6-phosphate etherase [Candidatus Kapabacteria bacterium]|nr:N-acetylmuramic acid 6-phosphate etherase [Candidatus Kapabacteria bacterium]